KRQLRNGFTVIWDGSNLHSRSRLVRAFLAEHPEIVAATLPAYAPEVNPDELVWGWGKNGPVANLGGPDTDRLRHYGSTELTHLQEHSELLGSFLEKTKLPLAA